MKCFNFLSLMFLSVFMGVLIGCSSTKLNLSEADSIALIAVNGNGSIYSIDEEGEINDDSDSFITTLLNDRLLPNNPERETAVARLNYAADYFNTAIQEFLNVNIIPKPSVITAQNYNHNSGLLDDISNLKTADGYSYNMFNIGAKQARLLLKELKATNLFSINFKFMKKIDNINFNSKSIVPVIYIEIYVYDLHGSKIIINSNTITGTTGVPMKNLYYDKEKLVEMYPILIQTAINQFFIRYMN